MRSNDRDLTGKKMKEKKTNKKYQQLVLPTVYLSAQNSQDLHINKLGKCTQTLLIQLHYEEHRGINSKVGNSNINFEKKTKIHS